MENERVFVDTSAFYALMDRSDTNYLHAAGLWRHLLEKDLYLYTSNYVIVETLALLQSRLGFEAANFFYQDVLGLTEVLWIEDSLHNIAYSLWLSLGRRKVSFVDCISFMIMRHHKVETAFAFDRHFKEQGFEIMSKSDTS
jgi:predicted nucleic acid-binding protein